MDRTQESKTSDVLQLGVSAANVVNCAICSQTIQPLAASSSVLDVQVLGHSCSSSAFQVHRSCLESKLGRSIGLCICPVLDQSATRQRPIDHAIHTKPRLNYLTRHTHE